MSIDGIDKTRWSCPCNSDQNCTQTVYCGGPAGGWVGAGGVVGIQGWVGRGGGDLGVGG